MTNKEVFDEFMRYTKIEDENVLDYRPCLPMYEVPFIPNAIVIWLKNGNRIIYIKKVRKNDN